MNINLNCCYCSFLVTNKQVWVNKMTNILYLVKEAATRRYNITIGYLFIGMKNLLSLNKENNKDKTYGNYYFYTIDIINAEVSLFCIFICD